MHTHARSLTHTNTHTHTYTQDQQQSQLCDPLGEIQRVTDLLALQQALNLWLDSGIGFNSSGNENFFSSGDGENNETNWFFCGEAGKEKNKILEQLVNRVNHGDSYQQGRGGGREREGGRERGGRGGERKRERV